MPHTQVRLIAVLLLLSAAASLRAQPDTTLLVNIDHRPATSLNADSHVIVDQYATVLYDFHQNLRKHDVLAVDDPRNADGVPLLHRDGADDGDLRRECLLVALATQLLDDDVLHLHATDHSLIPSYIHAENATPGAPVTISRPAPNPKAEA